MQAPENCCEDCEPAVTEDGVDATAVERVVGVGIDCVRVTKVIEAEDVLDGAVVGMTDELELELGEVVAGSAADDEDDDGGLT